jgi:hypothetical protein
MLRKYNEFLFESLILESIVVYSDKFRKILSEIDSPVSQALKEVETKDLDVANNYLDINDKDTISFITDRKAKEILQQKDKFATVTGSGFLKHSDGNKEIFDLLGYEPVGDNTYHPSSGEQGEVISKAKSPTSDNIYVKLQFPNGVTVVNQNNIRYIDTSKLPFSQNRQTIRTGRGVKALLSKSDFKFTDVDIEQFVNKYKSAYDTMNDIFRKFELVSGEDIAYWYSYLKYQEQKGTLGTSCMRAVNSNYFDIYVNNPDKCSLLILKGDDESKIKGRALIWKLDSPQVTFMDRIYTNNDSDIELFKQYAYIQGWYHKEHQNSSNDYTLVGKEGSKRDGHLSVKLKNANNGDYDRYPYLDTLKYFSTSSGKITTEQMKGHSDYITLEDTGGRWSEDQCDHCGGDGRVDCYECDGDGKVGCTECYSRSARRSTGQVSCSECDGDGEVDCYECNGKGQIDGEECSDCSGTGKSKCGDCDGDGEIDCPVCDGDGNLECSVCDGEGRLDCPEC